MADDNQGSIPYARFQEAIAAKNAAEAKVEKLTNELNTVRTQFETSIAQVQEQVDAKEAEIAQIRLQHDMDRTLLADGINDEGVIDYLRFKYSGVEKPEDGEKPGFSDWYGNYKKEKPTILQPFLKKAESKTRETNTGTQQQNAGGQQNTSGTEQANTSGGQQTEIKKNEEGATDQSHNGRTGNTEAISNLTPQSLSKMSHEQIKQMGGWDAILSQLPKA